MNMLKLRPPLVFASGHADFFLEGLGIMLKEVS
jgi:4-aminobutyrate aminotransferase-like enzyme